MVCGGSQMPDLTVPGPLHGLGFALKECRTLDQGAQTLRIAAHHGVSAGLVMANQRDQIPLEKALCSLPKAFKPLLGFNPMGFDALTVVVDKPRHLHPNQQPQSKQGQPQIASKHVPSPNSVR